MRTPARLAGLTLAAVLLAACSGDELVGIHITLNKDGSGTVTTRALVDPLGTNPTEKVTQGVKWTPDARAAVVAAQGTFTRLGDVKLGAGGLRFAANLDGDPRSLRVYLQRGPDAAWVKALVPDRPTREKMAKIYDPTGQTGEVGDVIRLEIELPGDVVASSVHPTARGVEADRERRRAYVLLSARTMTSQGEEMVWDVTWN